MFPICTCLMILLQVHKILLAATSDYFRVLLQGSMKETKEHKVDLKSLTADTLEQIIEFMYSGEMTFNFDDNLITIIDAASHLQVFSPPSVGRCIEKSLQWDCLVFVICTP